MNKTILVLAFFVVCCVISCRIGPEPDGAAAGHDNQCIQFEAGVEPYEKIEILSGIRFLVELVSVNGNSSVTLAVFDDLYTDSSRLATATNCMNCDISISPEFVLQTSNVTFQMSEFAVNVTEVQLYRDQKGRIVASEERIATNLGDSIIAAIRPVGDSIPIRSVVVGTYQCNDNYRSDTTSYIELFSNGATGYIEWPVPLT